jgi:hypothetical protein
MSENIRTFSIKEVPKTTIKIPESRSDLPLLKKMETFKLPTSAKSVKAVEIYKFFSEKESISKPPSNQFLDLVSNQLEKTPKYFENFGVRNLQELVLSPVFYRLWRSFSDNVKKGGSPANLKWGQKLAFAGALFELKILNHPILNRYFNSIANYCKKILIKEYAFIEFPDGTKVNPNEFVVIKAVKLFSGTNQSDQFLDFAFCLYHKASNKIIIIVEGQVKKFWVKRDYVKKQADSDSGIYKNGITGYFNNEKKTFNENDILFNDTGLNKYLVWEADRTPQIEGIQLGKKVFTPQGRISNVVEYRGDIRDVKELAEALVEAKHKE